MNEQIQEAIDKFKIPRPKVTIGEGLESAYLIPESELLSLLNQDDQNIESGFIIF